MTRPTNSNMWMKKIAHLTSVSVRVLQAQDHLVGRVIVPAASCERAPSQSHQHPHNFSLCTEDTRMHAMFHTGLSDLCRS